MSIPISKYPYTDLHEMNMDWVIDQVKTAIAGYEGLSNDFNDLKTYVEDFINNLDIDQAVRDYIDQLVTDGTMEQIVRDVIADSLDNVPTSGSDNLVKSGGVYDAIKDLIKVDTGVIDTSGTLSAGGSQTFYVPTAPAGYKYLASVITDTGGTNVVCRIASPTRVVFTNVGATSTTFHGQGNIIWIKDFA